MEVDKNLTFNIKEYANEIENRFPIIRENKTTNKGSTHFESNILMPKILGEIKIQLFGDLSGTSRTENKYWDFDHGNLYIKHKIKLIDDGDLTNTVRLIAKAPEFRDTIKSVGFEYVDKNSKNQIICSYKPLKIETFDDLDKLGKIEEIIINSL